MKKYDHIFFDLDNTIWDFEENSRESIKELFDSYLNENNNGKSFDSFFDSYLAINKRYWALYREGKVGKADLRVNRFHEALNFIGVDDYNFSVKFSEEYLEICPVKTKLVDGADQILNYVQDRGYRMSIITNGFEEVQHTKIKNCGLEKFFDEVITSERAEAKKPHPQIFYHAANLVDVKVSSCLMIGDNHESDIIGASNLGMDTVYFSEIPMTDNFKGRWQIDHLNQIRDIV